MHGILRQGLGVLAGAVLTAGLMIASGAQAQEPPTVSGTAQVSTIRAGAPHYIHYQGEVFNPPTGQPLANTSLAVRFALYEAPSGGNPIWQEEKNVVTNVDGLFNTQLGDSGVLDLGIFDGRALYLGVRINGEETSPRQPLVYVPYAIWARNADNLGGFGVRDFAKIVAYGVVDDDGGIESGRGFDSEIGQVEGDEVYIIDIEGVDDYDFERYTTLVTPSCARPVFVGTGSSLGDLVVDIWDRDGNRTRCDFSFMTLRRE